MKMFINLQILSSRQRCHNFLKLFMFFLIILTMYANLNVSFIKLMRILNDGDVDSNPDPTYKILKVVQGSFHQGDIRFGGCYGSYPRDIYPRDIYPRDSYPHRHLPTATITPAIVTYIMFLCAI